MATIKGIAALCGALSFAALIALPAWAQLAPPRTLAELKEETLKRVDAQAYPLQGLKPADAREALAHIDSLDRDQWAAAWGAVAERYMKAAATEKSAAKSSADYFQAWRTYAFAQWPTENSDGKKAAARKSRAAFLAYAKTLTPPLEVVKIPFEGKEITGYLRLPTQVRPAPLVIGISALDSRKEDVVNDLSRVLKRGIGLFAVDMPGVGEAPIKVDVGSERMFSAILDWVAKRPDIDAKRVLVHGASWSGYWAAKLAIVEKDRVKAAVVRGGPIADYFQPEWQRVALGTREYLFDLFPARASLYSVGTLDEFLAYGPRMSLKEQGLLDKPSSPMLLVNGEKDSQVPISDLYLLLAHGSAKDAWVNPTGAHTGRGPGWSGDDIIDKVVLPWIIRQLAPSKPTTGTKTAMR